tara:strand:- start:5501 stop:6169 length:669 start_codon:yes stop_codon:yes gene_type:complete
MGLFGKKKKRDISKIPELPKFEPDEDWLADKPGKGPKLPSYESAFDKKGPEMGSPFENVSESLPNADMEMPTREPSFTKPRPIYNERVPGEKLDDLLPIEDSSQDFKTPFKKDEVPSADLGVSFEKVPEVRREVGSKLNLGKEFKLPKKIMDNRPVFVQIDDYKDAMNNIEVLKQKIREVEYMLDRLNEIKSEEQLEISNCETSLNKIKESLIGIDKKLFEL